MQEKEFSELTQNLKQQKRIPPLSDAEYRRLLPSKLYKVGEALIPIQAGFMAWGFFVGPNKWVVLLSAVTAFFGIGFLARQRSDVPGQNEWIITKLTLVSICLIVQLLLSIKGSPFLCI